VTRRGDRGARAPEQEVIRVLEMTERTVMALRELALAPQPRDVRIFAEPGAGGSLGVELVTSPADDDRVVEEEGVRLYLDADAAEALDDMLLDAHVRDNELRFAVLERS
jgi:Fe-S cluster assembly iron-binding protein IscA